jgi:hypothetical protein
MIKITDNVRGYKTASHRELAVKRLIKLGHSYFVFFSDVKSKFALQITQVRPAWLEPGQVYISR